MFDFDELPVATQSSTQPLKRTEEQDAQEIVEAWAAKRFESLQRELEELRSLEEVGARRRRLRALQLELHPDKQAPEYRLHAQSLFRLVQQEWEQAGESLLAQAGRPPAPGDQGRKQAEEEQRRREEEAKEEQRRRRANEVNKWWQQQQHTRQGDGQPPSKQQGPDVKQRKPGSDEPRLLLSVCRQDEAAVSLQVAVGWTIFDVKCELQNVVRMHPGRMRLLFRGLELFDDDSVGSLKEFLPLSDLSAQAVVGEELANIDQMELELAQLYVGFVERVRQSWRMLQHAPLALRADRDLVLAAVQQDWRALRFATPEVCADREVVRAAMSQDVQAFELADERLRADRKLVLEAVAKNWRVLDFVAPSMLEDHEIFALALEQDWAVLEKAPPSVRSDRALILPAVRQQGHLLRHASARLQGDREVALAAVRQHGPAMEHVAAELRRDRRFVLQAVRGNGAALRFVDPKLRDDDDVRLAVTDFS